MSQSFRLKSIVERKSQVFFFAGPANVVAMATLRIPLADTVDVVIDVDFVVVDVVVVDVAVVDAVLVADVIAVDAVVVADVIVFDDVVVADVIAVHAVV